MRRTGGIVRVAIEKVLVNQTGLGGEDAGREKGKYTKDPQEKASESTAKPMLSAPQGHGKDKQYQTIRFMYRYPAPPGEALLSSPARREAGYFSTADFTAN